MKLHELKPAEGSKKSRNRKGRGVGSGWGKTAGRGSKGLNSRSGGGVRPGYEGGQMPIHRRLPKRGFTNIFKKKILVVNLQDLNKFENGTIVDGKALSDAGLIKGFCDGIKLFGKGDINSALTVRVHAVSKSAQEKIEKAGGKIEVI